MNTSVPRLLFGSVAALVATAACSDFDRECDEAVVSTRVLLTRAAASSPDGSRRPPWITVIDEDASTDDASAAETSTPTDGGAIPPNDASAPRDGATSAPSDAGASTPRDAGASTPRDAPPSRDDDAELPRLTCVEMCRLKLDEDFEILDCRGPFGTSGGTVYADCKAVMRSCGR